MALVAITSILISLNLNRHITLSSDDCLKPFFVKSSRNTSSSAIVAIYRLISMSLVGRISSAALSSIYKLTTAPPTYTTLSLSAPSAFAIVFITSLLIKVLS